MLEGLLRTLVKVAVASLIVGTILAHFGITVDLLMKAAGLSMDRIEDFASPRHHLPALPNLLLGLADHRAVAVSRLRLPPARPQQQRVTGRHWRGVRSTPKQSRTAGACICWSEIASTSLRASRNDVGLFRRQSPAVSPSRRGG